MKQIILYLSLGFVLSACSGQEYNHIDNNFTSYAGQFQALYRRQMPAISIEFSQLSGQDATCNRYGNGSLEILVDKNRWQTLTEPQRRGVIFHELGHCILGRPHIANKISYMLPGTQDTYFYVSYKTQLDAELFNTGLVFTPLPFQ